MWKPRRNAFTLIELVIVIAIVALLISVLVRVGGSAITSSRVNETRAVMETLNLAIEQFASESTFGKISYSAGGDQVRIYDERFGSNPPDELEGFDQGFGIPGRVGVPATDRFLVTEPATLTLLNVTNVSEVQNADIKAMVLAIRLYSDAASSILDKIPGRYQRVAGDEFLDRDGMNTGGMPDPDDVVLTYYVDTWGTPLQYFAVRDKFADPLDPATFFNSPDNLAAASAANTNDRLIASTYLVQQNRAQPLLVSYGPDGQDQFSTDFRIASGNEPPDLIQDFAGNDDTTASVINNPLNADNVYLDQTLNERIYQPGTN